MIADRLRGRMPRASATKEGHEPCPPARSSTGDRPDRFALPLGLRDAGLVVLAWPRLGGCGYSIRAPFDKSVKTVFVPVFKTQSFRRDLNTEPHRADPEGDQAADARTRSSARPRTPTRSSKGRSTTPTRTSSSRTRSTCPRELNATITVSVNWTHNPPTEVEKTRPPTIVSETVNFVPEVGETSLTAFYRVNQSLARRSSI